MSAQRLILTATTLAVLFLGPAGAWPQTATSAQAATAAVLNRYCVTCHSATAKTAGLVIDTATLANPATNAELWEKVVHKLRTSAMPPPGVARPTGAEYASTAAFLENALDRAAAARPNPGTLPLLRRLSRTEYQNAIRDLLALDSLPREMDYSLLLPADNVNSGFDNIADLLFVSPSTMERYLDAAKKVSRLAVGDPEAPMLVNIHRLPAEHWQEARVEELPFGTRGGLAVRTTFPVDGEYTIALELAGAAREAGQVEISIDGERTQLIAVGGGGRGRGNANALEFRIPVKAGAHLIGVTFIERNEARDEETLRPRMRARGNSTALQTVTVSGPERVTGSGNTPSRQRIFICRPAAGSSADLGCARRILSTLARRAYRRPSTDADVEALLPFYGEGRKAGGFDSGIQAALERLLVSPQFLFRIEREPANAGTAPFRVSDIELASRLSFFIWSSIPDDALLDAAVAGQLKQPAALQAQVKRMLADPRAEALVSNFAAQWLYLRDLDSKRPDEILFPEFDETLRSALRRETDMFLASVLLENRTVLDLITANYTFLNERLAQHYGIPNVRGSWFRRVDLPEDVRAGGLLGQGSILTITSYANRTSPVLRGKWVLDNLLAAPPPPPPANVPSLKTDGPDPEKPPTLREAMASHRSAPACSGCHARMDPIGFAMENFDAVGKWRTRDSGNPIDASGTLPEGTAFSGVPGLKRLLIQQPDLFVSAVAEKLLMYAVGRNLQYYDRAALRTIVKDANRENNTFAALVAGIVRSVPFQMRQAHRVEK